MAQKTKTVVAKDRVWGGFNSGHRGTIGSQTSTETSEIVSMDEGKPAPKEAIIDGSANSIINTERGCKKFPAERRCTPDSQAIEGKKQREKKNEIKGGRGAGKTLT